MLSLIVVCALYLYMSEEESFQTPATDDNFFDNFDDAPEEESVVHSVRADGNCSAFVLDITYSEIPEMPDDLLEANATADRILDALLSVSFKWQQKSYRRSSVKFF